MTQPQRTAQYRTTKLGVVRVYSGHYSMPADVRVAMAVRPDTHVHALHEGQEAFATAPKSTAHASAEGTIAYACHSGAHAYADHKGATSIAMVDNAAAYASVNGTKAIATVRGARARRLGAGATLIQDEIQSVWPNDNRDPRIKFT
jgi:hypothetical protein